jgi:hypothetical protein
MAQVEMQPAVAGKTKRRIHASLKIDMTPMVDLGFLLISFFIFTTTLTEKTATALVMPKEGDPPPVLKASHALTVLLAGNDQVYAYEGDWQEAFKNHAVFPSGYNEYGGLGKLIRAKQKWLQQTDKKEGRDGLVLLIKPTSMASYKNMVDALDEAMINDIKKYMIVTPSGGEESFAMGGGQFLLK